LMFLSGRVFRRMRNLVCALRVLDVLVWPSLQKNAELGLCFART